MIKSSENSIWHFLKSSTSCGFHFFHCLQISLFSDLMPFSRTLPNHSTFFCGAPFYRISLLFSMDVSISSLGFSSSTGNTDFHATLCSRATGARTLPPLHARTRPRRASNKPRPFLSIGEISIFHVPQYTTPTGAPAPCSAHALSLCAGAGKGVTSLCTLSFFLISVSVLGVATLQTHPIEKLKT